MSHEVSHPAFSGAKIRVFRGGTGEQVLFLHGGAGLSIWTPFFQAISEKYDIIVPEHPGFGQSDNPDWLQSVSDLALFYLDVIDGMNLENVHLVGNSFGGWIAAEMAVRNCSKLKSLTLIGPAGLPPVGEQEDLFRWSHGDSTRKLFYNQAIVERVMSAPVTTDSLAVQLKNQTTMARLGASVRLTNPTLANWLHRIKVPTHIVWGRHDNYCPVATAQSWSSAIGNSKVSIIEEAGHLPHAERPDVTAEKVVSFLLQA